MPRSAACLSAGATAFGSLRGDDDRVELLLVSVLMYGICAVAAPPTVGPR